MRWCLRSQADRAYIDFATVVVGTTATKQITLVNTSDCSIHYQLELEQRIEGPYPEEHTRYDPMGRCWWRIEGPYPEEHTRYDPMGRCWWCIEGPYPARGAHALRSHG